MSRPQKVHYMRSHTLTTSADSRNWELIDCGVERPMRTRLLWTKDSAQVTCKKCQQRLRAMENSSK